MCEIPWGTKRENSAPIKYRGQYKTEQSCIKSQTGQVAPPPKKKLCRLRVGTGRCVRQSPCWASMGGGPSP